MGFWAGVKDNYDPLHGSSPSENEWKRTGLQIAEKIVKQKGNGATQDSNFYKFRKHILPNLVWYSWVIALRI